MPKMPYVLDINFKIQAHKNLKPRLSFHFPTLKHII
jgi:hypothetical protein